MVLSALQAPATGRHQEDHPVDAARRAGAASQALSTGEGGGGEKGREGGVDVIGRRKLGDKGGRRKKLGGGGGGRGEGEEREGGWDVYNRERKR